MARVVVNGIEWRHTELPDTWGDLLDALEADLTAKGTLVTAVRFDGVDEPTFRSPALLARRLADLAHLEVESGSARALVARALQDAAGSLAGLSEAVTRVGADFRGADILKANQALVEVADGVRALVALVAAVSVTLQLDLEALRSGDMPMSALAEELAGHVQSLTEAQEARDWLTVADVLEFDLHPALDKWNGIFQDLTESAA
jgi:hypothetical protein